ncbi:Rad52/Rad22 family DNA repair protein [uncultured Sulfitobacter sp.]|uniref:Rad52/Rad22 family DNA repair protein n=1 Tax=uncultured Sulfitobacter sp. TaxID=191468 RepID=UPI0030DA9ADF|tara:strand:+ start:1697 stop:2365 length:669 start_codon:yes stop_codon:yes gene_type:complete
MDIKDLSAEFTPEAVHWRVQGQPYERNGKFSAMALAYIDARDVMDRLDAVCGPENWQDEYEVTPTGLIICKIGVCIDSQWVWKSDGAGETAVEGKKGGMSDALKRAAVKWGIGRYLYRLDSPWVACNVKQKNGKAYWKEWAENPWDKVKTTTYHAAEQAQEGAAFEASIASAITAIEKEPDFEGLRQFFTDLAHREPKVARDERVIAAKDARKAELNRKEAA